VSQKNIGLSIEEITTYFSVIDVIDEYVFVRSARKCDFLAYTKEVYDVLFETTIETLLSKIKKYTWNKKIKGTFCVRSIEFEKEIATAIWHKLKKPKVDLKNPNTLIHFFFFENKVYCGIRKWINPHTFFERKAHLRPEFYPASLDPQLALAMVNLSRGKKIVDPFCGTGGILIEGAYSKRKMIGYDISKWMLEKCTANLKNYKLKVPTAVGDATKFIKKCDAIVTELPFGKNTKSQDLVSLYTKFLENAARNTRRMVVSFPDFVDYNKLIRKTKWNVENDFAIYIHKSLTKHVVVMRR